MLLLSCTGVDAVGAGVVAEGTGAVDVMYCCCLCICCVCSCIVEVCGGCTVYSPTASLRSKII